ncbi:RagB/SusD family nutrient uptake outer membrane protein [Segatella copri]|uniref:RagB/SusD family nutrient uptake outer membrane protein n=1 Tax=Segatella copri TaxID=165179 RepID=UPI003CFEAB8A
MKTTIKLFSLGLVSVLAFSSCSDSFLEEKKNYDNVNKDIYNYYEGCNGRVNDIYSWCLPTTNDLTWKYPSMGNADEAGKSTEEYSGLSSFVDPQVELSSTSSTNSVPDFFMGDQSNIQASVYGRIRNINDVLQGISGSTLPESQKNEFLGQVYFFRAWCYYNLFKWYGGVPLVKETQDPVESSITPRSSSKETYEFILEDLNKAADMLAAKTENGSGWTGSNWGRVTSGTALALKGRVMLLWCSPLFNRADDKERWKTAYETMKADLARINKCGYHLYNANNNVNGSAFAQMFTQSNENPEAVFVTLYNNVKGDGLDNQKNNNWERQIRPANTGGSGKNASQMLINMFPMSDGKLPESCDTYTLLARSEKTLDSETPFLNRDKRFYRTFAFPGFRWAYNGNASERDANNPSDGANYVLWNYVWYTSMNDAGNPESGDSYGADNLLKSRQGVYVRKKSDDLDVNSSPLYEYEAQDTKGAAPFYSAAPLIELRYAEVLLNLAEVAAGAGHLDEAVGYVKQIRERAGYSAANSEDDGITPAAYTDQATCISQILYERQIEFAYEGKRFDDLRRWMLFDGGTGKVEGAPSTWTLTGWGGNTCTWLGFKALNGQRRENIQYRVADKYGVGGTTFNSDPLLKAGTERPKGVDLREDDLNTQLENLSTWYKDNLKMKVQKGDGYDSNKNLLYMNFRPKYYFLGFSSGTSNANKALPQTIGWGDYNNGGANGTFDPLAE